VFGAEVPSTEVTKLECATCVGPTRRRTFEAASGPLAAGFALTLSGLVRCRTAAAPDPGTPTGGERDDTRLGLRTAGTAEVGFAAACPSEGVTPAQAHDSGRAAAPTVGRLGWPAAPRDSAGGVVLASDWRRQPS
jgi:hypothetical protein